MQSLLDALESHDMGASGWTGGSALCLIHAALPWGAATGLGALRFFWELPNDEVADMVEQEADPRLQDSLPVDQPCSSGVVGSFTVQVGISMPVLLAVTRALGCKEPSPKRKVVSMVALLPLLVVRLPSVKQAVSVTPCSAHTHSGTRQQHGPRLLALTLLAPQADAQACSQAACWCSKFEKLSTRM